MVQMTRAQFRRGLQDGLNAHFGRTYRRYKTEWTDIYNTSKSNKAYEEQVLQEMLGAAQVKAEGEGVAYDSGREVWSVRYVHQTYALAFSITEESIEDNLYGDLGAQYSSSLALSLQHTKEIEGADILNNGHDTGGDYNGGDGKPLYSTTHPLSAGGTFANKLATAADLSEESLEDLCVLIEGFTDERGIPMSCMPVKLVVPRQLRFVAQKIMNTQYATFSNENTTNEVRKEFKGVAVNHRLTDPDAYHVLTDCPMGLQHFTRRAVKRGVEGDFETGNMRYKASERYSQGWSNPRGVAGSEGAA